MNSVCLTRVVIEAARQRPWFSPGEERLLSTSQNAGKSPVDSQMALPCLNEVDLFCDLTPAEIEQMNVMAPSRKYTSGQIIFNATDSVAKLFIVKRGRVRVFRLNEEGKALTLAILEPGAVFGEMVLVGQSMYGSYAEAIDDCLICTLGVTEVERFLISDKRIALRISRLLGQRVSELEDRLADSALLSLEARIASTLNKLATPDSSTALGTPIVRLTHEQIAGLLGVTREAVSKLLSDFASAGVIKQGRGKIYIRDRARLAAIAKASSAF